MNWLTTVIEENMCRWVQRRDSPRPVTKVTPPTPSPPPSKHLQLPPPKKRLTRKPHKWKQTDSSGQKAVELPPQPAMVVLVTPPTPPPRPVSKEEEQKEKEQFVSVLSRTISPHTFLTLDRYEPEQFLGKGSYARVFKVYDKRLKVSVALKYTQEMHEGDTIDALRSLREIVYARQMGRHPNIVQLLDVLPYGSNQEAFSSIWSYHSRTIEKFAERHVVTENKLRSWAFQILCGLKYLHSAGIIHRDISPANIMIDDMGEMVTLIDFGLSCAVGEALPRAGKVLLTTSEDKAMKPSDGGTPRSTASLTNYVTTRWTRAPEVLGEAARGYDETIDCWSLGCVLVHIYRGESLFQGVDTYDQLAIIFRILGRIPDPDIRRITHVHNYDRVRGIVDGKTVPLTCNLAKYLPDLSQEGRDFIRGLLTINPTQRLTVEQALHHKWLDDVRARWASHNIISNKVVNIDFERTCQQMESNTSQLRAAIDDRLWKEMMYYRDPVKSEYSKWLSQQSKEDIKTVPLAEQKAQVVIKSSPNVANESTPSHTLPVVMVDDSLEHMYHTTPISSSTAPPHVDPQNGRKNESAQSKLNDPDSRLK